MTSERGTVTDIDTGARSLVARMEDGRSQPFAPEEMGADRLVHGYAVTVHRSQGATVDAAHHLHDGGGRELAYVAMSRARQSSIVYCVADDLDQAREDLTRAWSRQRRPYWVVDVAREAGRIDEAAQRTRKDAERSLPKPAVPTDPRRELADVDRQLAILTNDRDDIHNGTGRFHGATVGHTARHLDGARHQRLAAESTAENPDASRKARRAAGREALLWADTEQRAKVSHDRAVASELRDIEPNITQLEEQREQLVADVARFTDWLERHPDVAARLDSADRARDKERIGRLFGRHDQPRHLDRGAGRDHDAPEHGFGR